MSGSLTREILFLSGEVHVSELPCNVFLFFFIIGMRVLLGSKILTEYMTLNQGAKWHINSIPRIRSKEYSHIIRYYDVNISQEKKET